MKNKFTRFPILTLLAGLAFFTSCNNDDEGDNFNYEVPASYNFEGANYTTSSNRIKMAVELNSYLGSGTTTILSQTKATNLFNNTNAPFTNTALNTSGINLAEKTADATTFKGFIDQHVENSNYNAIPATKGIAGYIPRGSGKILVGPNGMEYNQAIAKGMMGSLFFKEAMSILAGIPNEDNNTKTNGATLMERRWDEVFGYLGVPANYDPAKAYTSSDTDRPLLWGGYLKERGEAIQAGKNLFEALRTGRAAIGAKDYKVRDEQIKIIQETWEKLAAAAALHYVTDPQQSANVGNLGSQFHALSEGYGFALALKYRATSSKLIDANFQRLKTILETNYYDLVNEPGFVKLKEAEGILRTTYGL